MFFRVLHAEKMKLRHSPVWLAFLILPIIPAIMGTFNYLQNRDILQGQWYDLWTQHTLFVCLFFLPALFGVYAAYLFRLEHLNHNWNAIMTAPIRPVTLYLSKLVSAGLMVLLTQIWTGGLFILSGKFSGLTDPIPPELAEWLLFGAIGGLVISALQLCISLVIRSFAVPVGIAMMGGIAGLAIFAKGYGVWFPYSSISIGMRTNRPGGPMTTSVLQFVGMSAFFIAICIGFAALWLNKKDVVTK